MEKSKKNAAGPAGAWLLFGGASSFVNNDSSAKIVIFCLLIMTQFNDYRTGLYGLKNGCWSGRLLKLLAVTVAYL
jgi:hypothetical protein